VEQLLLDIVVRANDFVERVTLVDMAIEEQQPETILTQHKQYEEMLELQRGRE
jgi:hypothetical protein